MTKSEQVLAKYESFVNPGLARLLRFMGLTGVEREAEGCFVTDWNGKQMIDCVGGYGTFAFGHRHPRIVRAVEEQLQKMPLSSKIMLCEPMADLAERLARVTPGDLTYTFVCNSGAEAVEGAIKLARIATGKPKIISMINSFHGKTLGSLSASGKELYRQPFEPLLQGFVHVPFGDLDRLEAAIGQDAAAVLLEPIQGEAGIIVPPQGYLREVRELCDRKGVLLIADEVQTGMGRTGHFFACESEGVVPDIMCLAKALGGGVMPIGAFIARPHLYDAYKDAPLLHTSTFGGNPLACAAANAALDVLVEERLHEEAAAKGVSFMSRLHMLAEQYPGTVAEVRGRGLMIGIEFSSEEIGGLVMADLIENGVLTAFALNNLRVTRLEPPLTISSQELDLVVDALDKALEGGAACAVS
ncbi:aspartate aminotransferase family protein [Effusibacillus lacus]|uniref:Aspartate aminotransferase family protein n=1 Tax=Effusibacillus lacus TaxID=1348429 RepID=A0A292YRH3_9BACL|nr:aspartate aminotransferase family protein [Effusibacillus lacus]TCS70077.1 putrescine aminotransferase [Effusibacillus lacus]GAX91085.1 aspartate aminotransferase family protein [Effusibacillus lacus]